ncbi:TetR/AcrR family transcriptional regulator [Alteraurantiacibacter buctensis]|uniref:TetR family transcriptional regulator n=1 Tax=Alteraurantiacibacter buctensis TaxID=1503981 RepID=A0A844YVI0_9SPHN|nr:TetR/AcrR family transcriptional regulator [Alteraurantiacibacter buctensis]MXO71030.1 TetR family transcriptional regulator [Alteraurantiacibacter buctensis]
MGKPGKTEKRSKGRPVAASAGVGRDALIKAARELLQELPPEQVTATAIARRAGGDPALVRYYFGNRTNLLLEVAQAIGSETHTEPPASGHPPDLLADFIHATFRFTRSARNMQRLMLNELDSASSGEVRESVRQWNRVPVDHYAAIKALDDGGEGAGDLIDFDPLFLHLAVVGISDFFITGGPLVKLLTPEGTDMDDLAQRYEEFVKRLLLDGLRKRPSGD